MKARVAALLALGPAACSGQGGGNGNGAQVQAGIAMRPGMWETTYRILSIDLPDAPPEIVEGMRAGISTAPVTERACLTPAEAAEPAAAIRGRTMRGRAGYDCDPGENLFAGGRVRMTLACRSATGQPELRQAMVGSYTSETLQMAVTGETVVPSPGTPGYAVHIESTLTGRRIGDCPAGARN
jgi:hypothetical protein